MSGTIFIDIITGVVVPIATLYAGYKINVKHMESIESKRKKEEERELEIKEAKATKKAVETFKRKVMGQYLDVLNNGKSYNELLSRVKANNTVIDFIDIRSLFEDELIYRKSGKWDNEYDKIKEFYETKVYGQHNNCDYTFAKNYVELIRELNLEDEMNERRAEFKR